ncbi:hypothetical protein QLQ12_09135 [Actinoplanes sp. NEAU-A12]|uniref:Uncharacterized protein n=1 Tax=Actinoplanes sandaracinus TaxID=3045177 RepID=A0ABT6WGA8_9ACTN|nr:hypothetical protein [Actinoplanes sandaracinus]MDI6098761.1 hypothetical protein [Actinoplanes sandaracinus]
MDEPVARLPISNHSDEVLEVVLEWYGRDYRLMPGESLVVHTVGRSGGGPTWPGTVRGNEPFQVDHCPGSIQVHVNGTDGWVTDLEGNELECGHQRSMTPPPAPGSGTAQHT